MNTGITIFNMPEDKILITKGWLLGFVEGDSSFLFLGGYEPGFSIELSSMQYFLLEKIKEYLIANLGFDSYSIHKLTSSETNIISVTRQKERSSVIF